MTLIRSSYAFQVRLYNDPERPTPLITGIQDRTVAERQATRCSHQFGVDADVVETRVDVYETAPGLFESRSMPITKKTFYVHAQTA